MFHVRLVDMGVRAVDAVTGDQLHFGCNAATKRWYARACVVACLRDPLELPFTINTLP